MLKTLLCSLLFALSTSAAFAQLTVQTTTPADGTTQVALSTTVSFTFNQAVDPDAVASLLEVNPEGAAEVGAPSPGEDGRTVSFEVTHRADTDYTWVLSGAYEDPETGELLAVVPFVLHYTTADAFGSYEVRGRVGIEGGGSPVGTLVYLASGNVLARTGGAEVTFEGAAVVTNPTGVYTVPYVRDGTYWPVAARISEDGEDFSELIASSFIGFYDPDGDGDPDSLVVAGGDVTGVQIDLQSLAAFSGTAGAFEAEARAVAAAEAGDNQLIAVGSMVSETGVSPFWSFTFYSPSGHTQTDVEMSAFNVEVETTPYDGSPEPSALPEAHVDSDVAVQVALENGGQAFLESHAFAQIFASAGTGADFFEQPDTLGPAWTVAILAFSEAGFELFAAFVDLETGALLGVQTTRPAATVKNLVDEARAALAGAGSDFELVGFASFGVGRDGTSTDWSFTFYSDATAMQATVYLSSFGPPYVDTMTLPEAPPSLPETYVDSDVAMAAALAAGGEAFLAAHEEAFVWMEAGYLDRFSELQGEAYYVVTFEDYTGEAGATLEVAVSLETGVVRATRSDDATATEPDAALPEAVVLLPNYPNPFNPATRIPFRLEQPAHVFLAVYDALGREVAVLVDGMMPAGAHDATWTAAGRPSGVYLYRLTAGGLTQTRSMLLVK